MTWVGVDVSDQSRLVWQETNITTDRVTLYTSPFANTGVSGSAGTSQPRTEDWPPELTKMPALTTPPIELGSSAPYAMWPGRAGGPQAVLLNEATSGFRGQVGGVEGVPTNLSGALVRPLIGQGFRGTDRVDANVVLPLPPWLPCCPWLQS